MNEPTKQEMDTFISELKVTRPRYLKRAKRRADKFNKKGWNVACPKCGEDQMDILHVFPDPNTGEKDQDWHVECICGHVGFFTIIVT